MHSPRKYSPSLGFLFGLPLEVIQSIFFALVAQRSLGPPTALVPLFTTSRDFHAIATSSPVLARVFRFKFDTGAIARRHFNPMHADLKEQLVHACTLLRELRSGNYYSESAGANLFSALVLLFENDGKNYAQLEWAGLTEYAEGFVRNRLWEDAHELNEGWPLDNIDNASALWVLWLTLTQEKLQNESIPEREGFILYVLPYILLTFRYPASQAPPNHFHLPLHDDTDRLTFPIPSASENPPHYPIYRPDHTVSQPHFRAIIGLRPPLASIAAKLLYVARREIRHIAIPTHLPLAPGPGIIGPTQADYHDLNRGKAATLPRGARWDWTSGCAWGINFPDEGDETEEERSFPPSLRIAQGDEESRRWDTTWWRMRLCHHWRLPKPVFEPGEVFRPGSMKGQWKGRIYVPTAETFHNVLYTPQYPGPADDHGLFSEAGVYILMQPFHVDMEEHHRICGCASSTSRVGSKGKENPSTSTTKSPMHETRPCGVIPTPQPLMQEFSVRPLPPAELDLDEEAAQAAAAAAAAEAEAATVNTGTSRRPDDTPPVNEDWNDPFAGNLANVGSGAQAAEYAMSRSPSPALFESGGFNEGEAEEGGDGPPSRAPHHPHPHPYPQSQREPQELRTIQLPVDHSMRNAWFPGRMGGVTFVKRQVVESVAEREERMRASWEGRNTREENDEDGDDDGNEDEDEENESPTTGPNMNMNTTKRGDEKVRRRDEMVFSLSGMIPDVNVDAKCGSIANANHRPSSSSSSTSPPASSSSSWVYETYDPARVGVHDLHMHLGPSSLSSSSSSSSSVFPSSSLSSSSPPPTTRSTAAPNPSCAHCVALAEARSEEKRKEEDRARRVLLDRAMQAFSFNASSASAEDRPGPGPGVHRAVNLDDEELDMEDLDMNEFCLEMGDESEEEGEEEEKDVDDDDDEDEDRISVLGDDLPNGQPGFWTSHRRLSSPERGSLSSRRPSSQASSSRAQVQAQQRTPTITTTPTPPHKQKPKDKRTFVPPTRREFDRARITTSSPCSGIADIALTGHTPAQHTLWYSGGRGYTFYGRVRRWDGLIGIMRVGAVGRRVGLGLDANVGEMGDERMNLGGLLMDTTFIFGYLVGEGTFVGEWRIGGADPLKPAWSGPIVLSRR